MKGGDGVLDSKNASIGIVGIDMPFQIMEGNKLSIYLSINSSINPSINLFIYLN
jgi:hypothetical protein